MATIYIALLNEGTDVWRPVEGTALTDGTYRVEGKMPGYEEWAFAPGSIVHCIKKTFSSGLVGMAVTALAA